MVWWRSLRQGGVLRCNIDESGARAAELTPTFIDAAFRPVPAPPLPAVSIAPHGLHPLASHAYRRAVRRTEWWQRAAAYRYAAMNVWRYRPRMLVQLAAITVRNKLGPLLGRLRGRHG
jgi:hypothetical protein